MRSYLHQPVSLRGNKQTPAQRRARGKRGVRAGPSSLVSPASSKSMSSSSTSSPPGDLASSMSSSSTSSPSIDSPTPPFALATGGMLSPARRDLSLLISSRVAPMLLLDDAFANVGMPLPFPSSAAFSPSCDAWLLRRLSSSTSTSSKSS
eukprot:1367211-Rhodomonas_salina.1